MPIHAWADLRISTDFEVPELPPGDATDACTEEWQVRRFWGRSPLSQPRRWFHRWRQPNGGRWLSFARVGDSYLLRFTDLADFAVHPHHRTIEGYRPPATPDHTFNHLLLDQVLPLATGGPRRLTLHASVVEIEGRAVAFLGATRHGKSTLAAALARRGHGVLSDDCCVLCRDAGGLAIAPTYPGLRLFPQDVEALLGDAGDERPPVAHYSTKRRVVPAGAAFDHRARIPPRVFYALLPQTAAGAAAATSISPRSWRDGVLEIVGATFYLDVRDATRAREGFALAAEAASACPVRVLSFPWDLPSLDGVVDAIVNDR